MTLEFYSFGEAREQHLAGWSRRWPVVPSTSATSATISSFRVQVANVAPCAPSGSDDFGAGADGQ